MLIMPENITYEAVGSSFGVYYLFYRNGEFIESCDENERDETLYKLIASIASNAS